MYLIDTEEYQKLILNLMHSEELNKMLNATIYKDDERAKDAIRDGMAIASLYTCKCNKYVISVEGQQEVKQNDNIEIVGNAPQHIKVGRVYRHFKGELYLVLDLAQHSETGEQYVVYKALYGDCKTYIRPYQMFASVVDREKYPDVEQEFRFQLVED